MSDYNYDDDELEEKAEELEAAKKITEEACIAYLCGDHDQYWEAMRRAAKHVLSGYNPHFLTRSEIKKLMEIYGEPKEDNDETDYAPPPPPPPLPTAPTVDAQQSQEEFEKQVEELARTLDAESKFTKDAWESWLMGNQDIYWMDMKVAALRILVNEPVTFLTPEEMQRISDEYHSRERLSAPPQYNYAPTPNYITAPEQVGCLEGCLKFFVGLIGLIFIGGFVIAGAGIVLALLANGSGIIILIVLYKLYRYFKK